MTPNRHAPYVQQLAEAGDWPALVRYWLAPGYGPAMEAAIECVRRRVLAGEVHLQGLIAYLEAADYEPLDLRDEAPKALLDVLEEGERLTLHLLVLHPRTVLDYTEMEAFPEREAALRATEEAAQVGEAVHDGSVASWNLGRLAHGLYYIHRYGAAARAWAASLETLRELAQERPEIYQRDLASTLNDLGSVLCELGKFEASRAHFAEALRIRRGLVEAQLEDDPRDLVITLNDLGSVHSNLRELDEARARYEEALAIQRKCPWASSEYSRRLLGSTLEHLGSVHFNLGELGEARARYEEALAILQELARGNPKTYRPDVARTLSGLGKVLGDLGELEAARASYEDAGRLFAENAAKYPGWHLNQRRYCWTDLGELLRRESALLGWPDYRAAREALRQARDCSEESRSHFFDAEQRKRVLAESARVYDLLARTCLDLWELSVHQGHADMATLREAVETAEEGRGRQMLDLLANESVGPKLPPEERARELAWHRIRRQYEQAGWWLRQEEACEARGSDGTMRGGRGEIEPETDARCRVVGATEECSSRSEWRTPASATTGSVQPPPAPKGVTKAREAFDRCKREHDKALEDIRGFQPEFDPEQSGLPVKLDAVQKEIPTDVPTGLVQFSVDREGGFAMIVMRDQVQAVRLPELTRAWAGAHAVAWFKSHDDQVGNALKEATRAQRCDEWGEVVEQLLEPLAVRVVRPVVQHLAGTGIKRLVLAPHRELHLFPLHACKLGEGHYLGDEFEIVYTPSLSIWHRCVRRQREVAREVLLIQNPTPDATLPFTDAEAACVARRFQPHVRSYRGFAAQKEVLIEQARSCQVWHYCGHSRFQAAEPGHSALILGGMDEGLHGDKWLTLRDVFTRLNLPQNSLSVLNGCESGMLMPEVTDDYVNLPTGFLYAGARCVISTLWEVNDLSSALAMEKYYALWQGDNGANPLKPAAALREAVRWIREDIRNGGQVAGDLVPALLAGVTDAATRESCEAAAMKVAQRYPDRPPFASAAHWAPFFCSGAG